MIQLVKCCLLNMKQKEPSNIETNSLPVKKKVLGGCLKNLDKVLNCY